MKAAILEEIGRMAVKDVPDPEPEAGAVVLKVKACSICGADLRTYHHGHSRIKLPQILGHEIAGEIVAAGEGVNNFKSGERVAITPRVACGHCYYCQKGKHIYCLDSLSFGYQLPGGYAEYLLIPRRGVEFGVVNRIADNVSFQEASLAEVVACCLRAQRTLSINTGDTVVVIGGGPVGVIHCRLAKVGNASQIILVENNTRRLGNVNLYSVDKLIDSTETGVETEILSLTGGRGAEVVMVACSSAAAQEQSISLTSRGGRINFFGGLPPDQPKISIDSNLVHYREISTSGSSGSTPDDNREALDILARRLLEVGDLITHTYPLDSVVDAFAFADTREGMRTTILP